MDRPAKADTAYVEALEHCLQQDPHTLGYAFSVWTVERAVQHLSNQTGIELSAGRLRALLRRLGYVYRRPKRDLSHLQEADARETAQALLEALKRGRALPIVSYSLWTKPA